MKAWTRGFVLLIGLAIGSAWAAEIAPIKPEVLLDRSAKHDPALLILDVRTPEEFAQGHVPGAKNIPHDQLKDRIAELMGDKDKDIVLYCRSGRRAGLAAETLQSSGFSRLLHLEGDMIEWTEARRPLEK